FLGGLMKAFPALICAVTKKC
uniref:Ranalexin-1Ca n=1 Tax=Lithobates clamitans TaxID=145282 RepID=RLCA_LITCL|nr:RecName: Full=Ranalexin-1Ca [Lithobates clamitans]